MIQQVLDEAVAYAASFSHLGKSARYIPELQRQIQRSWAHASSQWTVHATMRGTGINPSPCRAFQRLFR